MTARLYEPVFPCPMYTSEITQINSKQNLKAYTHTYVIYMTMHDRVLCRRRFKLFIRTAPRCTNYCLCSIIQNCANSSNAANCAIRPNESLRQTFLILTCIPEFWRTIKIKKKKKQMPVGLYHDDYKFCFINPVLVV